MKHLILITSAIALATALPVSQASAQQPKLHINTRWKECSFQLDPSLTQGAWHKFTQEAGLVAYFRPLSDARPMGRGNFEVSMLKYATVVDDNSSAWNDTFVHPDSTHWLEEEGGIQFPGLTARVGVTPKTDVGVYFAKNPNANYGFYGVQLQRGLTDDAQPYSVAARGSFMKLFGPADLDFTVYGADVVASRRFAMNKWITVSPYGGVSGTLNTAHEKTIKVDLRDEHVLGAQAMVGAVVQVSKARLAAEYNFSQVNSFSLKIGVGR